MKYLSRYYRLRLLSISEADAAAIEDPGVGRRAVDVDVVVPDALLQDDYDMRECNRGLNSQSRLTCLEQHNGRIPIYPARVDSVPLV